MSRPATAAGIGPWAGLWAGLSVVLGVACSSRPPAAPVVGPPRVASAKPPPVEVLAAEPAGEAGVSEASSVEIPVVEAPASEAPVSEAPVSDVPVSEAPAGETPVSDRPAFRSRIPEDPNAHVVRVPVEGAPSVVFRLAFYAGSIDDPVGKEGLTRLSARLMLEGGTGSLSYSELLEQLYPWAAEIGVQTDKEQTVFYGRVHPDHADRFLPLLVDVVRRPRFDPDAFARVRREQINDLDKRLRATDDESLGKALLEHLMYGETHPYGHHPGGTLMGLSVVTLEDVRAHARAVFGRRRLVIGIGGAFTAGHERMLTSALAGLSEGTARPPRIPAGELPASNQVLIVTKPEARAVAISMGFPHMTRRGQADWPALLVVQSFLGEHRQVHGLLMEQLREKRGLNYGDYAYAEAFRQDGGSRLPMVNIARRQQHFELWIRPVAPEDAALSIRLALLYLDRLVENGMSEEDFRRTVQFLKGYTRLWSVTPMRRLGYAIDDHFYGTTGYLDELRRALARLTLEEVNTAIRTHLRSQPLFIAAVAPDAPRVLEGLRAGDLIRKTYPAEPSADVLDDDAAAARAAVMLFEEDVQVFPVEYAFVR